MNLYKTLRLIIIYFKWSIKLKIRMYLHQLHFLEILFDIHSIVLKLYYFVTTLIKHIYYSFFDCCCTHRHLLSDNIWNIQTISKSSIFVLVPINIFTSAHHVVVHLGQWVHTLGNVYEPFFQHLNIENIIYFWKELFMESKSRTLVCI